MMLASLIARVHRAICSLFLRASGSKHTPHVDIALWNIRFLDDPEAKLLIERHILWLHGFEITGELRCVGACQSIS